MDLKLKPLRKIRNDIIPPPRLGEIIKGKIISKEKNSLFLDLGSKGIGVIYGLEFQKAKETIRNKKADEEILAKVINLENDEGYRELSAIEASKEFAWKELQDIKDKGKTIEVSIKGANKGGLTCEIKNIPAFLPVSQLSPEHYPKIKNGEMSEIAKALQKFVGEKMSLKILDLDPGKEKLILSEKATFFESSEQQTQVSRNYQTGDAVEGKVSGITSFGAFIDLGNKVEGLLKVSEVSETQEDPKKILKMGQKVKAKVIEIIDGRIYLSLKDK